MKTVINPLSNVLKRNFATAKAPGKILVLGDGNMMGEMLQMFLPKLLKDGNEVTIVKNEPPIKPRKGVKYCIKSRGEQLDGDEKYDEIWSGMKPQVSAKELSKYAKNAHDDTVVVSIEAGTTLNSLSERMLGVVNQFIRLMPKKAPPGQSIIALTTNGKVKEESLDYVIQSLELCGTVLPVTEDKINSITSGAASFPATVFTFFGYMESALLKFLKSPPSETREILSRVVSDFDNPKYQVGMTDHVKSALSELDGPDTTTIREKVSKAVKVLGPGRSALEKDAFVAGALTKLSEHAIEASQVSLGLSEEMSKMIISGPNGVIKTSAISAGIEKDKEFVELAEEIRSPNGTTWKQESELLNKGPMKEIIKNALRAGKERGEQIGRPLDYELRQTQASLDNSTENSRAEAMKSMVVLYNMLRQHLGLHRAPSVVTESSKNSGEKLSKTDSQEKSK